MLEATWRVIARNGIEGTTTREIARESNCSTGVLAHYFKDKDEILRLALDFAHDKLRGRLRELHQQFSGVLLLRAVLAELLPIDSGRQLDVTLEVSFWGRAVAQSSLRESEHLDTDRWHARIRDLLIGSMEAGELPDSLDPDRTASALVCFVDGLGVHSLLYPERFGPAEVEALLDGQLRLLGADTSAFPKLIRRNRRTVPARGTRKATS